MSNSVEIKKKIGIFKKTINVPGDKSLSIRWVLFASLAKGKSKAKNLLMSEDVIAAIKAVKKLGIKVIIKERECTIFGKGIGGYNYKKNLTINAQNSGTLGRLILGLLVNSTKPINLIGDKSLSKRDFYRITKPLKKFGVKFYSSHKRLPIIMKGSKNPKSINYQEKKGSAQCKTSIMLAALKSSGTTKIKAKKSRNHTELLFKHLKLPITIKKTKQYDLITVKGVNNVRSINYNIPGDISSCAFFIVLTILSKNSKLLIKNININPTRIGVVKILKKMNASIKIINKKNYKGELIGDIIVESSKNLKAINCPIKYNTSAIDEFLIIFLVASKAKGISYFKKISELNKKESPRLKIASKILNKIGIKTKLRSDSIKIYGNPNIKLSKKILIKNFMKDHRVFMMSTIAALSFGGEWKIYNKSCINTSFPSFIKIAKKLGAKIN